MSILFRKDLKYVGMDGNPVKFPKDEFPESYSPYVLHRKGMNEEIKSVFYSDRMEQDWMEDCMGFAELESFESADMDQIELFLSFYFQKPIKLIAVEEAMHLSKKEEYYAFHLG